MRHANPGVVPDGWVRFNIIRSTENPDEVVCFGSSTARSTSCASGGQEGYS
jgi:hypothetical protein